MDLAEWAANAAKELSEAAKNLSGSKLRRRVLIKPRDAMAQNDDEAKRLAEDPAYLEERAFQNRQLEKIEKVLQ